MTNNVSCFVENADGDKVPRELLTAEVERNGTIIKLEGLAIAPKTKQTSLVIQKLPADNPKSKLREAWLKE